MFTHVNSLKQVETVSLSGFIELCGTPGYLAPEILKCSMDDMHAGYGKEVDL